MKGFTAPIPRINAGSFSRLDDFESCKLRAKLKYVDRIPEPERGPPPKGKEEWPDNRGERIHREGEMYVKSLTEHLIPELQHFAAEFEKTRALHEAGHVECEQMWCFTAEWEPTHERDFANTAFRIKTDLTITISEGHLAIVDLKTGKRFGNEIKHAQQLQLYTLGAAIKYPHIEEFTAELWYADLNHLERLRCTREQALKFFRRWDERNKAMLNATTFPANPNRITCQYCPYTPWKSGHCKVGVR